MKMLFTVLCYLYIVDLDIFWLRKDNILKPHCVVLLRFKDILYWFYIFVVDPSMKKCVGLIYHTEQGLVRLCLLVVFRWVDILSSNHKKWCSRSFYQKIINKNSDLRYCFSKLIRCREMIYRLARFQQVRFLRFLSNILVLFMEFF